MKQDLIFKINKIISKKEEIDEDNIRSLLIRKILDKKIISPGTDFLILRLFCNWVVHNEITQSNTGLRILAEINDALVSVKDSSDLLEIQGKIANSLGFSKLRKELILFLKKIAVVENLSVDGIWIIFINNLIEIIRDVPLSFPVLSKLDKKKQKIYNEIAQNAIKDGAGVISIKLFKMDRIYLLVEYEDTTKLMVPLLIDSIL